MVTKKQLKKVMDDFDADVKAMQEKEETLFRERLQKGFLRAQKDMLRKLNFYEREK